jgi:hypothetical protein
MKRLALIACVLCACSFEPTAQGGAIETNRCSVDAECVGGSCVDGMCTAQEIANTLQIALEVSLAQPAVNGANTFFIERFAVDGPSSLKTWQLPTPLRIRGQIRQGDVPVEARVSFVPMTGLAGREPNAASTLTAPTGSVPGDMDYELRVTSTGKHTMIVRPTDTGLPPVRKVVDLSEDAEQSLDYSDSKLTLPKLTFMVDGIPEDRAIILRAVDRTTGAVISSDGRVEDGSTTLTFGEEIEGYRLIAIAEDSYDREPTNNADCDNGTPVVPVFSIDSEDIEMLAADSARIELPQVPSRIVYRGTIDLCPAAEGKLPPDPITLPVTLRARSVDLGPSAMAWRAELSTDVEATPGEGSSFEFCVDLPAGDYAIVVTPPAMLPCELFAEQRVVGSPDGESGTANVALMDSPVVIGSVDFSGNPVVSAVIEARSLGREGAVQLKDEAASLTAYNRSRQTTTDELGEFSLPLDIGSYDITVRPPASSGYAWAVLSNATFGRRSQSLPVPITMTPPLPLDCKISFEAGSQIALGGAEIAAYAEIETEGGGLRAVPIGAAVADDQGRFTLLLPAEIQNRM